MIAHQHPGMDTPAVAPADLTQPEQERLPVLIALKNRLPPVTPSHHMINRPRILMSQGSWHARKWDSNR